MKPRGLLIAVVLLAVLGGLTWWSNKSQGEKKDKPADANSTKLLTIPDDQFQEIRVKKVTGELITLKRENGKWRLTSPQALSADQDAASGMSSALSGLTSEKLIDEKATDLKSFGLDPPTLEVEIQRKDGKTDRLLVGDDTPAGSGAYAKLAGDARVFTISSTTKTTLDKRPDDLRDKRLLPFDSDKLSRVELTAKGPAIEFGKNGQGEWTILKPRPLRADGGAVDTLISKLKDAKMDLTGEEKFATAAKVATATITDAGGTQTMEVRRGKEKDKDVYAKTALGSYKANSDLADALDKSLDDFRNKKLFDFGFSDPSKVDVQGASYSKEGDKWKSGGKTMDNITVQNLIDKLRDLAAVKFAEKGGGTEVFHAAVTSNSGKRVEKVTITKQGTQYFAQREGEPGIYELEAKSAEDLEKTAAGVKEAAPEPAPAKKK